MGKCRYCGLAEHGKPSAVLMSYNEFMRLQELEDHLWALCAQEAAKEGYLGQEETTAFLKYNG